MLDRALVRNLFCIVESPKNIDRWFMRESKPGHRERIDNATLGELLVRLVGQFVGAYCLQLLHWRWAWIR